MDITLILTALIHIAVLVLVIYVVLWVLGQLGINIPSQILNVIWVIVALIALLYLVQGVVPLRLR